MLERELVPDVDGSAAEGGTMDIGIQLGTATQQPGISDPGRVSGPGPYAARMMCTAGARRGRLKCYFEPISFPDGTRVLSRSLLKKGTDRPVHAEDCGSEQTVCGAMRAHDHFRAQRR